MHSLQSSLIDNYQHNMQPQFAHQHQIQQKMNIPSSATNAQPSSSSSSKQANDPRSKFLPSQVPSHNTVRKITGNNSSMSSWTPTCSSTPTTHHGHTSSLCATGHGASNCHTSTSQAQNNSRDHHSKAMAEIHKSLVGAASRGPSCILPPFTIDGYKREIAKVTSERDAVIQEYQLVMSERDNVHSEIERLNEALSEMTARLRSCSEEMNRLKREVATSQAEKDRYKQELQELKDRYGADLAMSYLLGDDRSQSLTSDAGLYHVPGMRTSISRAINNSSVMNNNMGISRGSSGDLLRHQYLSTSSSNSSVVGIGQQKGQLTGCNHPNYTFDNLDVANYEIDQLRRRNAQLEDKVIEAQNEAEVSKKRRDWAVSEKKKMILERESIRYLCDSLRKERNTRDRELSKALTDNDELKRQVKELLRQLTELKEKLEESNRIEKENVNNCSRDSAIDTDDHVPGAVSANVDNDTNQSTAKTNIAAGQSARIGGHPGITSSESELLELSMKHHSISDASERNHRPESRLTDPRFTTMEPFVPNQGLEHRSDCRVARIPPRFPSLASEPASRPPSVAGDPFDPWSGQTPESSYITAHSGHLTPANIHGSTSGHHTPAGILTPCGHLTPGHDPQTSTARDSNQYLDVKPYLGEVRDIVVAKSSEPLGKHQVVTFK